MTDRLTPLPRRASFDQAGDSQLSRSSSAPVLPGAREKVAQGIEMAVEQQWRPEDLTDEELGQMWAGQGRWAPQRGRSPSVESVASLPESDDGQPRAPESRKDLEALLKLRDNLNVGVVNEEDAAREALAAIRALSPQTVNLLNQLREPHHDPDHPLAKSISSRSGNNSRAWSREGKKNAAASRSPTPFELPSTPASEKARFFPSTPSSRSDSRASPRKMQVDGESKGGQSPRLVDDSEEVTFRRRDNRLTKENLENLSFPELRQPDCVFRPAFVRHLAKEFASENWDCLDDVRKFRLADQQVQAQAKTEPSSEKTRLLAQEALQAAKPVAHFAVGANLNVGAPVMKVLLDIEQSKPRELADVSKAIEAVHRDVMQMLSSEPLHRFKKLGIPGIERLMSEPDADRRRVKD